MSYAHKAMSWQLSGAQLSKAQLSRAQLSGAQLSETQNAKNQVDSVAMIVNSSLLYNLILTKMPFCAWLLYNL